MLTFTRSKPADSVAMIERAEARGKEIHMDGRQHRSRPMLPALGIFAGALAYTLLPTAAFGAHDVAVRASVTGAVAGVAAALILALTGRSVARWVRMGGTKLRQDYGHYGFRKPIGGVDSPEDTAYASG